MLVIAANGEFLAAYFRVVGEKGAMNAQEGVFGQHFLQGSDGLLGYDMLQVLQGIVVVSGK